MLELGKMLLHAIVMILGFGLAFGGAMMMIAAPDPNLVVGWAMVILAPAAGCLSLWRLIVLNRSFQDDAWAQINADPSLVFARWTDAEDREVILARSGLFVAKDYYAFAEPYSRLESLRLDAEVGGGAGVLHLSLAILGGKRQMAQRHEIPVPAEQLASVEVAVAELVT